MPFEITPISVSLSYWKPPVDPDATSGGAAHRLRQLQPLLSRNSNLNLSGSCFPPREFLISHSKNGTHSSSECRFRIR